MPLGALPRHLRDRARDAEHLVVGEGLQEAVGDPVGVVALAPGDQPDPVTVEVYVVIAAVDAPRLARAVEDRRVGPPVYALEAEVVALRQLQDHLVSTDAVLAG